MTEDQLERATRALRATTDAGDQASGEGRGRVLHQLAMQERARARRVAVLVPLAALVVTSTAIAAATGRLTTYWEQVKAAVTVNKEPSELSMGLQEDLETTRSRGKRTRIAQRQNPAVALSSAASPEVAPPLAAAPVTDEPVAAPAVAARPTHTGQRHLAVVQVPPAIQAAPEPDQDDGSLALFRAAQRAQFAQKDCARALSGWDAYLRAAPSGALAPEARWNRTVCLLKLARKAEARRALEAFAAGAEDGYHQNDARALLDALDAEAP